MEKVPTHYGLPVVGDFAWAFTEEMIYDAWARYVEAHSDRFDMNSLMRCATLPPQVEEAIAVVRGPQGRMGADVVRLVQKHSERLEFRRRKEACPHDCVCPGAFESKSLDSLPEAVRESLWRVGLEMGITPTNTIYCARLASKKRS